MKSTINTVCEECKKKLDTTRCDICKTDSRNPKRAKFMCGDCREVFGYVHMNSTKHENHKCQNSLEELAERCQKKTSCLMDREEEESEGEGVKIDAYSGVSGINETEEIDYSNICKQWGCEKIDEEIVGEFEKIGSMKVHRWLRRGVFFAHRDLKTFLKLHKKGEGFFLYTGRGPSGKMHLGHILPFAFTKYLQDVFKCPLVIQLTDDEKYFVNENLTMEDSIGYMYENCKDIIACGFDPDRTFIFSDFLMMGTLYPIVARIKKVLRLVPIKKVFGFKDEDCIGKVSFPPVQICPCFDSSFPGVLSPERIQVPIPDSEAFRRKKEKRKKKKKKGRENTRPEPKGMMCLIPAAIDQDPYFRLARDIAEKLGYQKPGTIYSGFMPGLKGPGSKMSTSDPPSAIFLDDSRSKIKKKIGSCFSGGKETREEQRKYGADLAVDVPFKYLELFLESDEELEDIRQNYSSGKMLTGEVKKILIHVLQEYVASFQERRKKVTDEDIRHFMSIRKLKGADGNFV